MSANRAAFIISRSSSAAFPAERRVMFIKVLKESIRSGTFDGAPVAELFELAYSARGKAGIEERRKAYRDFVVDNNEAFAAWFEGQLTARKASGQFATRQQLEAGAVQVGDLAVKYRRRSGNQKRRAKR